MDKKYYEQAALEWAEGLIDRALLAKALATSQGDPARSQATYLSLRAEEIRSDEVRANLSNATDRTIGLTSSLAKRAVWPLLAVAFVLFVIWALIIASSPGGPLDDGLSSSYQAQPANGRDESTSSVDDSEIRRENEGQVNLEAPVNGTYPNPFLPKSSGLDAPVSTTTDGQNYQFNIMLNDLARAYPQSEPSAPNYDPLFVDRLMQRIASHEQKGATGPRALQAAMEELTGIRLVIPPGP